MTAQVLALHRSQTHSFSKSAMPQLNLLAGLGVEGDVHCGETVKHRSRVAQDPTQPNLRQVHLIQAELFEQLSRQGLQVSPGQMGENLTTQGLDLLALPVDTVLSIGDSARLRVTGLRNPCGQIEQFQAGLLAAVLERAADGRLIRKAGIMAVVLNSGLVRPGDAIRVLLPPLPHRALERV
ncbi:MOSC domain-containing protein YiiM [Paucibacter oligotrophus]|uniref:MOSC domain-containing protein YiiM n=1 Tax=Roseateles oligotrophus TaxID=1769250 RepID=A0A840LCH2_9BURK|nr:MOSC domain-containing protein [Roseateles oligotrophus]MBB4843017.1 MOSC domain-containing protein YiiM [Roseateles oligotrophus]